MATEKDSSHFNSDESIHWGLDTLGLTYQRVQSTVYYDWVVVRLGSKELSLESYTLLYKLLVPKRTITRRWVKVRVRAVQSTL